MLSGDYLLLYKKLISKINKNRIFHDPLHTLAFGTDASFYRLIPKMVIKAKDEGEVSFILDETCQLSIPVTFRAAGTSLSGQAITDSVLVIAGEHWKNYRIEDNGYKVNLQPGLIGSHVNKLLLPYGRKIGPDPASINAAMIGGIAANNASGMCCGTAENSYKTLDSMRIILAGGTILDTSDQKDKDAFMKSHPKFIHKIEKLAESVKGNDVLAERITHKFRLKNTTGYSLNALVDYSDPFQIIEHLMIGSEGTLGFISEIRYNTVVEHPCRASSLMIFPDIEKACIAVSLMKSSPVAAVELIDRAGLLSVENEPGIPQYIKELQPDACALLVETTAHDKDTLRGQVIAINEAIKDVPTQFPVVFTGVPSEYMLLWKIRKGLFPSVGAMRSTGTTVIIEDVAFPVPRLAEATLDLQKLLKKYHYNEAVIFGHALEGNLHFVFTQDFGTKEEVERYGNLMAEVADMVAGKYDGSLKAEHGTGRNMAPFVEMEWGEEAYRLMKEIKKIFDPDNLLNPGVIFNNDPDIHLKNLKPIPAADESIDKCMDCGFCEISCVSSELTLTPRQRIVVYRELSSLMKSGHEPHIASSLAKSFDYEGDATCATDGLCAISCPVNIDTGKLIKKFRSEQVTYGHRISLWMAGHMDMLTKSASAAFSIVDYVHSVLGTSAMQAVSTGLRKLSFGRIPQWNPYMPGGAGRIKIRKELFADNIRKVVYFPSCINRSMGVSRDHRKEDQLSQKMIRLLHKAGYDVIYPENFNKLCCGMAFSSKGYTEAGNRKSKELEAALLIASGGGEYPVLCDMSPCLFTMRENMSADLKLFEPVEFINDYLLSHLDISPLNETITVFPVCSMKKMGLEDKLIELAEKCAAEVIVPETNCCGFAGDRGFSYPELNTHGLRNLKTLIPSPVKQGYSNSRTCEIGLSRHSGITHKSIVYLVDDVSKALT